MNNIEINKTCNNNVRFNRGKENRRRNEENRFINFEKLYISSQHLRFLLLSKLNE